MDSKIFRASYSVIKNWSDGKTDEAVMGYFHKPQPATPAMEAGKKYHELWANEIKQTNHLPKLFGCGKLNKPQTELKKCVQLTEWLEFVGVLDCLDGNTIYEFKTGKTDSEAYANAMQVRVYQLLYPKAAKAMIYHYDQYLDKSDMSIVHLTGKTMEDALNWLLTYASEMKNYLEEYNLYEQFA
jgi:hypothetical protein